MIPFFVGAKIKKKGAFLRRWKSFVNI